MYIIDPAVQEKVLRIGKGGHHAPADDLNGLQEVAADEVIAGRRQDRYHQTLQSLPEKLARGGTGCVGERER